MGSLAFQSKAEVSKSLFPRLSYSVEYTLHLELSKGNISYIIDRCLDTFLSNIWQNPQIVDLKGRDKGAPLLLSWPENLKPQTDEIFYLQGEISRGDNSRDSFTTHINSTFLDFPEGNHIRHECKEKRLGSIPDFLPTKYLGRAFPLWPKNFRLSLDFFTNRFSVAMLGFTPLVTQSLQLEAKESELALRLNLERLRSLDEQPFGENEHWKGLCALFEHPLSFSLASDFRKQIDATS